jgi:C1A family cysteine protease
MADTLIEDVPDLAAYAAPLRALGYRSLEQFLGSAANAAGPLANYLNIDPALLGSLVANLSSRQPLKARATPSRRYALGARIDRIPRSTRALLRAPGAILALPAQTNLISEMQPVHDQGTRGTCVAHASGAAAEHYWRRAGKVLDLSRQFLYWDCKGHDGDPDGEGTYIAVAVARLVADGCCLEATWPYVMTPIAGNEAQDPPPAAATAEAGTYKVPSFEEISPTSVQDIKAALANGLCVAFTIPVYNSWYQNGEVERTGELLNPIPGENSVGGHAMCLVGYQDSPGDAAVGGGRFYLRNSWGTTWAPESAIGVPGYGTIPYSYIAGSCSEAYAIH